MESTDVGPLAVKNRLVSLATEELPPMMGDKYTRIVLSCFACLDNDNEEFGTKRGLKMKIGFW